MKRYALPLLASTAILSPAMAETVVKAPAGGSTSFGLGIVNGVTGQPYYLAPGGALKALQTLTGDASANTVAGVTNFPAATDLKTLLNGMLQRTGDTADYLTVPGIVRHTLPNSLATIPYDGTTLTPVIPSCPATNCDPRTGYSGLAGLWMEGQSQAAGRGESLVNLGWTTVTGSGVSTFSGYIVPSSDGTYGILTVTSLGTGAVQDQGVLTGTGVTSGTTVYGFGYKAGTTGTGRLGTYGVSAAQTVGSASSPVSFTDTLSNSQKPAMFIGAAQGTGGGSVWAFNPDVVRGCVPGGGNSFGGHTGSCGVTQTPGSIGAQNSTINTEFDYTNWDQDGLLGQGPFTVNLYLHNASLYASTAAIYADCQAENANQNNYCYHVGMGFYGTQVVKDSTIVDFTNSNVTLNVAGSHFTAISTAASTLSYFALLAAGQSECFNTTASGSTLSGCLRYSASAAGLVYSPSNTGAALTTLTDTGDVNASEDVNAARNITATNNLTAKNSLYSIAQAFLNGGVTDTAGNFTISSNDGSASFLKGAFGGLLSANAGLTSTAGSFSGVLSANATTASTSATTGAIVDAGGLGVAGAAYLGSTLNVTGAATLASAAFPGGNGPQITGLGSGNCGIGSATATCGLYLGSTSVALITPNAANGVYLQGPSFATYFQASANGTVTPFSESHAISTVTASFTYDATMHNVVVGSRGTPLAAAVVGALPACVTATKGRTYGLKKVDTSTNAVTLTAATTNAQTSTADLIDGAPNVALTAQYAQVNIQCDGAGNWWRGFY